MDPEERGLARMARLRSSQLGSGRRSAFDLGGLCLHGPAFFRAYYVRAHCLPHPPADDDEDQDDGEGLTHMGMSLSDADAFRDDFAPSEDDEDLDEEMTRELNFGGGLFTSAAKDRHVESSDGDALEKRKTKREACLNAPLSPLQMLASSPQRSKAMAHR